jgi:hypothetical protein
LCPHQKICGPFFWNQWADASLSVVSLHRKGNTSVFLAPKRLITFLGGDTVFFFFYFFFSFTMFTLSDPLSRRQEKWYWFLLKRNHVRVSNGGYRHFACLAAFDVFQINFTLYSLTKGARHVAFTPVWGPVIILKEGVTEQQHGLPTCDTRPPRCLTYIGAPNGVGRASGLQPSLPKRNLKNTEFVDTILSKAVRDLHFSLNQPLKSAHD